MMELVFRGYTECEFLISTTPGRFISVFFREFGLRNSANCSESYLEVRDGAAGSAPLLARLCGAALPDSIYSRYGNLDERLRQKKRQRSSLLFRGEEDFIQFLAALAILHWTI